MTEGQNVNDCDHLGQSEKFSPALRVLLTAFEYARDTGVPAWDFAVEMRSLHEHGLDVNDLRWLVCRGFVDHARDVTRIDDAHRKFRPQAKLLFGRRSCFVLTDRGVSCAECLLNGTAQSDPRLTVESTEVKQMDGAARVPAWDAERHELRVGEKLVKRFKWPALNQEKILAVFQEEGWPPRIDDPLAPQPDQDPKRRLHDTIKCLNRNQKSPLLRFHGDGTGEGIIWELVQDGQPTSDHV
jgi:hypothetical protein